MEILTPQEVDTIYLSMFDLWAPFARGDIDHVVGTEHISVEDIESYLMDYDCGGFSFVPAIMAIAQKLGKAVPNDCEFYWAQWAPEFLGAWYRTQEVYLLGKYNIRLLLTKKGS